MREFRRCLIMFRIPEFCDRSDGFRGGYGFFFGLIFNARSACAEEDGILGKRRNGRAREFEGEFVRLVLGGCENSYF